MTHNQFPGGPVVQLGRVTACIVAASVSAMGLLKAQDMPMAGHNMPMAGQQCEAGKGCPQYGNMGPEMMGMMQELQGMMQGMMAVHAYHPANLLQKKAELSLTASQVKTLESLVAEANIAKDHAKAQHEASHARILAEFKLAKPDPARVKAAGQEAMQDMAALHGVELSVMARAKGLLTDAQRAKVDAAMMDHAAHQ